MLYTPKDKFLGEGKLLFMRSFLNFGAPLEIDGVRYNDASDRVEEQQLVVADHHREINKYMKE